MDRPRRVGATDVPSDRQFDFGYVHEVESHRIVDWLRHEANGALSLKSASLDSALSLGASTLQFVRDVYAPEAPAMNPSLFIAASNGELAHHAPSRAAIRLWGVVTLLAVLAEVFVGGVVVLLGEGNAAVILVALLLAGFAALCGYGLAGLLKAGIRYPQEWGLSPSHSSVGLSLIWTLIGVAAIVALSYLRTGGEQEGAIYVVGITVLLAVMIALSEAIYLYNKDKYKYLSSRMFLCQQWHASERHRVNAEEGGSFQKQYSGFVHSIWRDREDVHRRHRAA